MRNTLRLRSILSVAALSLWAGAQAQQNVGINVTGAAPNASALLDLDVSGITGQKRGLLIPRMLRADRLAIPAPPTGLWVYQTDDVTAPVFDVAQEHGFWYFNGTQWVRWATGIGSWLTTGNAGTNPNATLPNYFGSRNALSLNMRTISPLTTDPQLTIVGPAGAQQGFVGIGTTGNPTERLDVPGAMRIFPVGAGAGSATNLAGTIRYDAVAAPNRWHFGKTPAATLSANTTLGSTTVTLPATGFTTAILSVGLAVAGPGIPPGATVSSITNATTFVISAAATATASNITLDFSNANGWQRLENAEEMVTSAAGYTRDSLGCAVTGQMIASPLSTIPPAPVAGTDNGTTVVTGNVNTPFPTNIGTAGSAGPGLPATTNSNYRVARTQYIFPATELANQGLCAGPITEIAFYALQNDVNLPAVNTTINCTVSNGSFNVTTASTSGLYAGLSVTGTNIQGGTTIASVVNGTTLTLSLAATGSGTVSLNFSGPAQQANVNCELRIAHTALNTFVGASWDNGVQASAAASTITTVVLGGWTPFTLSTPFNWNGVQNIVLDVYWLRGATIGNSPAVQLVTGLGYQATRQGLPTSPVGVGLSNVSLVAPPFDDNGTGTGLLGTAVPVPLYMTNSNSRPVTRIMGQVKTAFPANVPNAQLVRYSGGLMLGDAAWASTAGNYKGPGTIHAKNGVYDGNSLLNDHVFDKYFDGRVRPEDAEAAQGYVYMGLPELKNYLEQNRHLPNMPSRTDWSNGGVPSLGELQNGLWQQVETQALYITELERDLSAMETMAFGDGLDAEQRQALEADITRSPRLTEQQKLHLIEALRSKAETR